MFANSYTDQSYRLPEPGMYSVILEAGDLANNTKFVRRLVLYDPNPKITFDPKHNLFVETASAAANYTYQNNASADIVVTWDRHFRNALHEDNALLGMQLVDTHRDSNTHSKRHTDRKTYRGRLRHTHTHKLSSTKSWIVISNNIFYSHMHSHFSFIHSLVRYLFSLK